MDFLCRTTRFCARGTFCAKPGQHLHALMDHAVRHGEHTIPDIDGQQQCTLGVHRDPAPRGRALQALNGFRLTDLPLLNRAEQSQQLIHLHLSDPHVMQEGLGEGAPLLRRVDQPPAPRIRVHLEPPRRAADAQACGEAREHAYDELNGGAFAMEEGAEGLEKVATPDHTQQLPPGTATRMAIGTEIAPADPAARGTGRVRAEMVRSVHWALAATGGGDPWRWRSRGSDRGGRQRWLPRATRGRGGETGKRFRLAGAGAPGQEGLR